MTFKVRETKYYHQVYEKHCFHETKGIDSSVVAKEFKMQGHGAWHPANGRKIAYKTVEICCQCSGYKGNRTEKGKLLEDDACISPLEDKADSKSYLEV